MTVFEMQNLIKDKQNLMKCMYMHLQLSGILTVTTEVSKRFISCNFHCHIYTSAIGLAMRSITSCSKPLGIAVGSPHC